MGLRVWSGGEIFSKKIDNKIGASVGKQKTREGGGVEVGVLVGHEGIASPESKYSNL